MKRREFVSGVAAVAGAALLNGSVGILNAASVKGIKAVAFDAFPIFDPRPIFANVEKLFPGKGTELSNQWRIRQFEYTWLRTIAGKYADFWSVTEDALKFAAKTSTIDITAGQRKELLAGYLNLKAWPDAVPVLKRLKAAGLKLGFLSNFTPTMLQSSIKSAGLDGSFDFVISTDAAKTYKPDPKAYQLGIDQLKLKKEEILFVAFAGWDAAGAKSFGYTTYWANRLKMPNEELGVTADAVEDGLAKLPEFLGLS